MDSMCQSALQVGVAELGFSDHFDLHPNEPFRDYLDLRAWWQDFEACKQKYAPDLSLRAGVEIGEPHRFSQQVERLINDYPWDFILGSLHWVGDQCVFDQDFFSSDERRAYGAYFQELGYMVESGAFDILAHFDVVKRYGFEHYGPFHPEGYEDLIRPILRTLIRQGRALEINTSTLRRSIQLTSPDLTILGWFLEEGGVYVTLGSDAHTPGDVGFGLSALANTVRAEGLPGLAQFDQRNIAIVDF